MTIREQVHTYRSFQPTRLQIPVEPTHDPVLQAAEWRGIKIGAGFVAVVWALVYLL